MRKSLKFALFVCLFLMMSQQCLGSGFAIFTQGASSLGEGISTVAHGKNPEAIFYNPALLNNLDGTQIESCVTFVIPNYDYRSSMSNSTTSTESALYFPATLYVTHKYNDKISAGIGLFTPFGLGTEWAPDWEGRYITTKAEMEIFNVNPVISYRMSPSISFAAGLDLLLVKATLLNKINFSTLALPDGNQEFSGDGKGLGYNLGLYTELSRNLSFGISYRSEIEVDIEADVSFQLPTPALRSAFPETKGITTITFPQQLHAALAYRFIDRLTIEAGVRWEGWSSYDKLEINLENAINGLNTIITPKNWDDTFSFTMGGRYGLNSSLTLLAGYVRGNDPIPDDTFDPVLPDSTTDALTCGFELNLNKIKFGFAYSYQRWQKRYKNNSVGAIYSGGTVPDARANGIYKGDTHFISTSFIYRF
jgi:long-chain fatty acid transport protein